jgi:hypothetical protein
MAGRGKGAPQAVSQSTRVLCECASHTTQPHARADTPDTHTRTHARVRAGIHTHTHTHTHTHCHLRAHSRTLLRTRLNCALLSRSRVCQRLSTRSPFSRCVSLQPRLDAPHRTLRRSSRRARIAEACLEVPLVSQSLCFIARPHAMPCSMRS